MLALLHNIETVRFSFVCPGPLEQSKLPDYVHVLDPKIKCRAQDTKMPTYCEQIVIPSGLLKIITAQNRFGLRRVTAREKYSCGKLEGSIMTFAFWNGLTNSEELEYQGMNLLSLMLQLTWKRVKIFHDAEESSFVTTLSANYKASETDRFDEPNEWGIRELIKQ